MLLKEVRGSWVKGFVSIPFSVCYRFSEGSYGGKVRLRFLTVLEVEVSYGMLSFCCIKDDELGGLRSLLKFKIRLSRSLLQVRLVVIEEFSQLKICISIILVRETFKIKT